MTMVSAEAGAVPALWTSSDHWTDLMGTTLVDEVSPLPNQEAVDLTSVDFFRLLRCTRRTGIPPLPRQWRWGTIGLEYGEAWTLFLPNCSGTSSRLSVRVNSQACRS